MSICSRKFILFSSAAQNKNIDKQLFELMNSHTQERPASAHCVSGMSTGSHLKACNKSGPQCHPALLPLLPLLRGNHNIYFGKQTTIKKNKYGFSIHHHIG